MHSLQATNIVTLKFWGVEIAGSGTLGVGAVLILVLVAMILRFIKASRS